MCSSCCCPKYCNCNTACCFGFVIPLKIGTVLAAMWVLFSGLTFPIVSFVFWPHPHILIPSCIICSIVVVLVALLLANMLLKYEIIFRCVLYGVFIAYSIGCIVILIGLNVERDMAERVFVENFKNYFNARVPRRMAFQMLESVQIVYYTYLFFSYVYCGVIFQLFERECAKSGGLKRWSVRPGKKVVDGVEETGSKAKKIGKP